MRHDMTEVLIDAFAEYGTHHRGGVVVVGRPSSGPCLFNTDPCFLLSENQRVHTFRQLIAVHFEVPLQRMCGLYTGGVYQNYLIHLVS